MIQDKYSDPIDKLFATRYQTEAARKARWPGSEQERWAEKRDKIILFIARIGWGTVELTNYFLRQSSRDWVKRMTDEGWLFLEKAIIGDKTVSRNKPNGRVATIVLLSEKGQKHARHFDPRVGKRISRANQQQARHDLIALWSAVYVTREKTDLLIHGESLQIWSDQVMRGFIKDARKRPDITIFSDGTDHKYADDPVALFNIEVERRQKKPGLPEYEFLSKLEKYCQEEIETLIVVETESRVKSLADLFFKAEKIGLHEYYQNAYTGKWWPQPEGHLEKFKVSVMIGIWDHATKKFTDAIAHNLPD